MASILSQPIRLRQAAQQRRSTGVVADLSGEPNEPPPCAKDGKQLGIHAALGSTCLAPRPPSSRQTVFLRRITPSQAIAIEEDYPPNTSIIGQALVMALRN